MIRKVEVSLTPKEARMILAIFGFIHAGEISGGPYDDENPHQVRANQSLGINARTKIADALRRAEEPRRKAGR